MLWVVFAALLICYTWYKIVDNGNAEPDSSQRPSERPKIADVARSASRLMSDVGRGVSLVPKFLDDIDQFVSDSRANQKERARNENGHFGEILKTKQILLTSALETVAHQRRLQRELDSDPILKNIYEQNMVRFDVNKIQNKFAKNTFNCGNKSEIRRNRPIPAEFMSLKAHSIPFILHFTRARNLESIFTHGIVPISLCSDLGISPVVNDKLRWDRRTNSSSFSIGHPNSKMLWKYRQVEPTEEWAILAIDPSIIWQEEVAFCPYNAADRRISLREIGSLNGYAALKEMIGSDRRRDLMPYEPVDEQAEILVFNVVNPNQIMGVFFLEDDTRAKLDHVCCSVASFSAFESQAVFATRSHASQISESAVVVENYMKVMRQIGDALRSDPSLEADLDKQIAAMLTTRASLETTLTN